jgi:hypothetical protein
MPSEANKQPLEVVVDPLDPNRGPDVRVKVGVPAEWLSGSACIRVVLPRLAACALCGGGGCERCAGKGALPLREIGDLPNEVEVHLKPVKRDQTLLLRLPNLGSEAQAAGQHRGCVLLEVCQQPVATKNASLVTMVTERWEPTALPLIALALALAVLLLVAWFLS